jgi:hypothetical protein
MESNELLPANLSGLNGFDAILRGRRRVAPGADSDDPDVELLGEKPRRSFSGQPELGRQFLLEVGHAPAEAADKMLMAGKIGIEPAHPRRRAHSSDQAFPLEEVENPVDGGGRK